MAAIAVHCDNSREDDWTCAVTLREGGLGISKHRVRVSQSDLARLSPNASEPTALVEASFAFLLERESAQMINRSFDLLDIARYFPEYESTIRHTAGTT